LLARLAYVTFLGAPPAALRAELQILLLMIARMLQRPSNPFALLAACALMIIAVDPNALMQAGLQLSFAGVLGIIWLRPRVLGSLPKKMPRWLRDSLAASVAAAALTTPVAAIDFARIAPIGILASIVAVPLAALTVPALFVALAISYVSASVAHFLAGGCQLLL